MLGSRCTTVFMNSSIVSEKTATACRHHGGPVPVDHRERVHEGRASAQPRPRRSISWCKAARSQRRGALRPRRHIGRPVTPRALPQAHGRHRRRCSRDHEACEQAKCAEGEAGSRTPLRRQAKPGPTPSTFIGLDALDAFSYQQRTNVTCVLRQPLQPHRHHLRGRLLLPSRAAVAAWRDPSATRPAHAFGAQNRRQAGESERENLFEARQGSSSSKTAGPSSRRARPPSVTIGIRAFWRSGTPCRPGTRCCTRSGSPSPSVHARHVRRAAPGRIDTICFPAKLVHRPHPELARADVDRIFMPIITTVPSEHRISLTPSMCAVVKELSTWW